MKLDQIIYDDINTEYANKVVLRHPFEEGIIYPK